MGHFCKSGIVTTRESCSEKCLLIDLIRLTRYDSLIERFALFFFLFLADYPQFLFA